MTNRARIVGGRLGFAAGPFDIAVAYGELKYDLAANVTGTTGIGQLVPIAPGQKQKIGNVGGSWDFGFFKLLGYYDHEKIPNAKEDFWSISANFPFGQSEFRFGYDESKLDRAGATPRQQGQAVQGDLRVQPVQADPAVRIGTPCSTTTTRRG